MGWLRKEWTSAILTDRRCRKDHYGDLDFKVAGTRSWDYSAEDGLFNVAGITAQDHAKRRWQQAQRGRLQSSAT